jgi:glycosyltransferase involved in cell wall biosynthesis
MAKQKNIGIFHYQVGRTDGVSLELEKWRRVLEELGHHTYLCAGDLGTANGILIEEMYHHLPEIERLTYNTFVELRDFTPETYRQELNRWVKILETRFREIIHRNKIDFLIPQNVWCVAANPPVAIALENIRHQFKLPALAHNHDFYWERNQVALTCTSALELADKYLPPRDQKIQHVVINSLAQKELYARKGISSTVVPNVFDFDPPLWQVDEYNADFREQIGLQKNDILVLQATRVVARKGIELAVDFVKALNKPSRRRILRDRGLYNENKFTGDSKIFLVLAGYARDDLTGSYLEKLKTKAVRQGVNLIHIEDRIGHERRNCGGQKVYSLWDSYVFADFVTYPSLWEGWGNQFLEAIRAKLPLLIFEYPVYTADIYEKGFDVVSLGSEITGKDDLGLVQVPARKIEAAADRAVDLLTNRADREKIVENNFQVGKKHFSIDSLRRYLRDLMAM